MSLHCALALFTLLAVYALGAAAQSGSRRGGKGEVHPAAAISRTPSQ